MEPKEKKGLTGKQKEIILGGLIAGVVGYVGGYYIYKMGFKDGAKIAAVISFEETLKWLDQEFPHVEAMKLWEGWMLANPEKIMTIKI